MTKSARTSVASMSKYWARPPATPAIIRSVVERASFFSIVVHPFLFFAGVIVPSKGVILLYTKPDRDCRVRYRQDNCLLGRVRLRIGAVPHRCTQISTSRCAESCVELPRTVAHAITGRLASGQEHRKRPLGDDRVGRKLGPYTLEEVIGRGGMGVVYRARQPSTSRDVAVKVIGAAYARQAAFLRRFEQEAQAGARLQHPHILPVLDAGVAGGQPYLVTAYLPGGTLAAQIAAHPGGLPLDEAVRLSAQLAAALDYAHAAGVIHCDVKPGNVLLDAQGNAYLADFGIARLVDAANLAEL